MQVEIKEMSPDYNEEVARIIRSVLEEHGVNKPGTVFTDPATDDIYTLSIQPGAAYFVAFYGDQLAGACGIFPTALLPDGCVELVKLYVLKEFRRHGIGKKLIDRSITEAKRQGYRQIYLESMPELTKALDIYEKLGFRKLDHRLGNSGHFACDIWMVKDL